MHFLNRIMLECYVSNLLNQVLLPILLLLALENITITFHNVTQSYVTVHSCTVQDYSLPYFQQD